LGLPRGELAEYTVPGCDCVRIHHRGSYDEIASSIDTLYAYAIDSLDRDIAEHPAVIHYWDDPDTVAAPDLRSDVYLLLVS
jgi:DNA gyrase inhibitor GyrI